MDDANMAQYGIFHIVVSLAPYLVFVIALLAVAYRIYQTPVREGDGDKNSMLSAFADAIETVRTSHHEGDAELTGDDSGGEEGRGERGRGGGGGRGERGRTKRGCGEHRTNQSYS